MDTKWKVLKEAKPSDDDLKQRYAYHHYLCAKCTYLLYPNVYKLNPRKGSYHIPKDGGFQCEVRFVDVLGADGKLNESVGEEILGFQDKTGSCAVLKLYSLEQPRFSLNLREELGDRDRWIVNFLQVYWK